jgi:hypothetical protein
MKTITPQELLKMAAEKQGLTVPELEARYQEGARAINEEKAENLPSKPIRFD